MDKLVVMLSFTSSVYAQAQSRGRWGPVIDFPVIPVGAYIIPDQPISNRMLVYSASGNITFSSQGGVTQFAEWDHAAKTVTHREISNTRHDMFCPGMSSLVDGKLIISGGQDAKATSIFHPNTNSFVRGRGYQTFVTLSNGKVFALGGFLVRESRWKVSIGSDNHAWLFAWRDGSGFQAGPSKLMRWYNTTGTGSISSSETRDNIDDAMCAVFVMYDNGKIFSAGGAPDYTDSPSVKRAHLTEIDETYGSVKVERLPDMAFARGFANAVVLPDGKILITGGQQYAKVFNDDQSVLTPEIFDPNTKRFTQLADESVPRNYHSVSILMADGTVFSGGGGLCGIEPGFEWMCEGKGRPVDHPDGQFFEPPYLFDANGQLADRPIVQDVQDSLNVGNTLNVTMGREQGSTTFSIIRIGSVTHSVNSDQRRIALNATRIVSGSYEAKLPKDSGVVAPGYWFLFALNENGVPSIARTIQIKI